MALIDGVYALGTAEWDAGLCERCGSEFKTEQGYLNAVRMMLYYGMVYYCEDCMNRWQEKLHELEGHVL